MAGRNEFRNYLRYLEERDVKKEDRLGIAAIVLVIVGVPLITYLAHTMGYNDGYRQGVLDQGKFTYCIKKIHDERVCRIILEKS